MCPPIHPCGTSGTRSVALMGTRDSAADRIMDSLTRWGQPALGHGTAANGTAYLLLLLLELLFLAGHHVLLPVAVVRLLLRLLLRTHPR